MTTFRLGQRVTTTVTTTAGALGWPGAFSAPIGSHGTIELLPTPGNPTYGVLLDRDPDGLPTAYTANELNPA